MCHLSSTPPAGSSSTWGGAAAAAVGLAGAGGAVAAGGRDAQGAAVGRAARAVRQHVVRVGAQLAAERVLVAAEQHTSSGRQAKDSDCVAML